MLHQHQTFVNVILRHQLKRLRTCTHIQKKIMIKKYIYIKKKKEKEFNTKFYVTLKSPIASLPLGLRPPN